MLDSSQKRIYLEELAHNLQVSPDDVMTVLYGEELLANSSLHQAILKDFLFKPDGGYLIIIWKGKGYPGTQHNIAHYEFIGQMMEALNLYLHKTDYIAQIIPCIGRLVDYAFVEPIINQRSDCGIIVTPAVVSNITNQVCHDLQRPVVFLDPPIDMSIADKYIISVTDKAASKQVTSHLIELGHRRIAFIHGIASGRITQNRFAGYQEALAENGIPIDDELIGIGDWQEQGGYDIIKNFLALEKRPTAIFAANDRMAIGGMDAIAEGGLSIPEDISLVGFDDIASALSVQPALTTVRQPISRMGRLAGEYILQLLEGKRPKPQHIMLNTEFIIRDSTGNAP